MNESKAYRCSDCNKNWPFDSKFRTCPQCGTICWAKDHKEGEPLVSYPDAHRIKREQDFEEFCENRDAAELKELEAKLTSTDLLYADDFLGSV